MTRLAVVTGGAGAIGAAIAARLRETHHRVVVLDRDECDLGDEAQVRAAAREVLDRHGRCDVLVHAAAAFDQAALADVDLTTWRRVQAVNVEAAVVLAQELTPAMAANRFGRILLVLSDTVYDPPAPELLAYTSSKAALVGVTRVLARTLGPDGIAVTAVAPGLTRTPAAEQGMPEEAFAAVVERQALKRSLVPDDVAHAVAFLASEGGAALTGQVLCADGGLVLR